MKSTLPSFLSAPIDVSLDITQENIDIPSRLPPELSARPQNRSEEVVALNIRSIPRTTRDRFKSVAATMGKSMEELAIELIESCISNPPSLSH